MPPTAVTPKQGRWIAKPRKTRWFVYAGFLGIIPSQINLWFNLFSGGRGWGVEGLLAVYGLIFLLAMAFVFRAIRQNARALKETEAMMDGNFGDQYPADVAIVVEGKFIGSDRGILWFADDRLGFSGRASSFVLSLQDVSGGPQRVKRGKTTRHIPQNALVLKNAPKEAYVAVTPLARAPHYRERLKAFLPGDARTEDERLLRFLREEPEAAGDRQWPPLEPYTGAQASACTRDPGFSLEEMEAKTKNEISELPKVKG